MLRFAAFDSAGPATEWPLVGAHLLGPDDIPTSGRVTFERGLLVCRRQGAQPAALCLQYDAGPAGTLMLQTCLLPDRSEPYLLAVELARHRIKTFIAKSEEWQMFDLRADHPAMTRWERARHHFTEAITAPDPVAADRAGRRALIDAIEACERLAMAHAELLLHHRYGQRAASPATLGVRVWPGEPPTPPRVAALREFDVVIVPAPWSLLEVEEGVYRWDDVDRWIEAAQAAGKPVVGGPLLDFSRRALPQWMYVWQHDYDTCRDLAYDHVQRVVQRYGGAVGMWNVASGVNANDNFQFTPDQMIDLVRMAALQVKEARRGSRTMVELAQPFGETVALGRGALPPVTFVERLAQEGIRLDALGIQLLFGSSGSGLATRDLMALSGALDRLFLLELPVIVSAAGVPCRPQDQLAGSWRQPWSPDLQAKWASRALVIALSKPFVESFAWAELCDGPGALLPDSGLLGPDGDPRPVLKKLLSIRKRLRKPLGQMKTTLLDPASS
jgi:hypothetical protein